MGAIANHRMVSAGEAASATSASYDQEGKRGHEQRLGKRVGRG